MKNKLIICLLIGSLFMFAGCGSKENVQADLVVVSVESKSITEVESDDQGNVSTEEVSKEDVGESEWSNWVSELPEGVENSDYEIETRKQYRYQYKETMTSENPTEDKWSAWSAWSEEPVEPTDAKKVETLTLYRYRHK